MRVFVSVCETGSVSRTAELFELNQSTVSHTLDKMRGALRDPLFIKSGRNIIPNEKSLALIPRIHNLLADIEGLVATENYDVTLDARPVVLAIATPALLIEMKNLHRLLTQLQPRLLLDIRRVSPRNRIADMLTQNDVDLAITVAGHRYPSIINHCSYGSEELVVFYDPACRGPVRTVTQYTDARHAVVGFGGNVKSEIEKVLAAQGLRRHITLSAPTASMLGNLIQGTDIIATMPRRLGDFTYKGLSSTPLPMPVPRIMYDLVWHRRNDQSGRNKWLRQCILDAGEAVE
ncbi:LysR family transcriptional regulator [Roseobacter fucihabitans]|nr:LysR family transcriptional regulator [Roseobacter litoralis]